MQLKNIITNKYILYIVVFVALANVIGYLTIRDYNSLIFFFVIALLSSYFSKNMTINLLVAILATNIIFANNNLIEGMSEGKRKKKRKRTGKCYKLDKKQINKKDRKNYDKIKCKGRKEAECSGVCKWTDGGENHGVPSSTPERVSDDPSEGDRIDSQATLNAAYENLQGMLGKGGIQNLSKDTKNLVQQQKELMKTFEGLGPMIKQAGGMMESLKNMPDIGQLQGMMKTLNGSSK